VTKHVRSQDGWPVYEPPGGEGEEFIFEVTLPNRPWVSIYMKAIVRIARLARLREFNRGQRKLKVSVVIERERGMVADAVAEVISDKTECEER
jgi:hypothetical protein